MLLYESASTKGDFESLKDVAKKVSEMAQIARKEAQALPTPGGHFATPASSRELVTGLSELASNFSYLQDKVAELDQSDPASVERLKSSVVYVQNTLERTVSRIVADSSSFAKVIKGGASLKNRILRFLSKEDLLAFMNNLYTYVSNLMTVEVQRCQEASSKVLSDSKIQASLQKIAQSNGIDFKAQSVTVSKRAVSFKDKEVTVAFSLPNARGERSLADVKGFTAALKELLNIPSAKVRHGAPKTYILITVPFRALK